MYKEWEHDTTAIYAYIKYKKIDWRLKDQTEEEWQAKTTLEKENIIEEMIKTFNFKDEKINQLIREVLGKSLLEAIYE